MLTGDLEAFKKQSFILKEGVEYRIKISFKVWEHSSIFSSCWYLDLFPGKKTKQTRNVNYYIRSFFLNNVSML